MNTRDPGDSAHGIPCPVVPELLRWLELRACKSLSLRELVEAGIDRLPLPGTGATLSRWQMLAAVAAHDLSLAKLFEGHTDALAIQAELGATEPAAGTLWGTWCAEPPSAKVQVQAIAGSRSVRISGTKSWCSGAATVTHAVLSGWNEAGEACLVTVAMHQPGVTVTEQGWQAVGMADSASVDVHFDNAVAAPLGQPGDYVRRAGFWQGGAGIAACWWGGAAGIGRRVHALIGITPDAHRLAHLGSIDVALSASAALLRECAAWIDAHPSANSELMALRARLAVEAAATEVLRLAGRALGAGPLCRDARFARAMADLPVYLRQSHAERDLAHLGAGTIADRRGVCAWKL